MRHQESDVPKPSFQQLANAPYLTRDVIYRSTRKRRYRAAKIAPGHNPVYPVHLSHGEDIFPHKSRSNLPDRIVDSGSDQPIPTDGRGIIDVALRGNFHSTLIVNSEVICSGQGRAQVTVELGYHFVEVQNWTSYTMLVKVEPGQRKCLGLNLTRGAFPSREGAFYQMERFADFLKVPYLAKYLHIGIAVSAVALLGAGIAVEAFVPYDLDEVPQPWSALFFVGGLISIIVLVVAVVRPLHKRHV